MKARAPVHFLASTPGGIAGFGWFVDVDVLDLPEAAAPVVSSWRNEWGGGRVSFRLHDEDLWEQQPLSHRAAEAADLLLPDEALNAGGRVDVQDLLAKHPFDVRHRGTRYPVYMSERYADDRRFAGAAEAVRAVAADTIVADGKVWKRSMGPTMVLWQHSIRDSRTLEARYDAGSPHTSEDRLDGERVFSAFDEAAAADVFGEHFKIRGLRRVAPIPEWPLAKVRNRIAEAALRSACRHMVEASKDARLVDLPADAVVAVSRVKEPGVLRSMDARSLLDTANALLSGLPDTVPSTSLETWTRMLMVQGTFITTDLEVLGDFSI